MPKINTHLHIALKLSIATEIQDFDSFLLGNAYPDCWKTSVERSLRCHYKDDPSGPCDLERFRSTEEKDAFSFGHYFHLWVDNRISEVDVGDISKYDCLICDMPVIAPTIQRLRQLTVTGKKHQALQNVLALESESMPLYLVPEEKQKRYHAILDMLADEFLYEIGGIKYAENLRI